MPLMKKPLCRRCLNPETAVVPAACRKLEFLESLDLPELGRLGLLVHRRFKKREVVLHEGEPGRGPFILCSGSAKLYLNHPDGRMQIVRIVSAGDMFGLAHVLAATPNAYSVETLEKSEVMMFEPQQFNALAHESPAFCSDLVRLLAQELNSAREIHRELSYKTGRQRVAQILFRLAQDYGRESGQGVLIDIPLSRSDLADLAAMVPETFIRILKEFKAEGTVLTEGKFLVLPNPSHLTEISSLFPSPS